MNYQRTKRCLGEFVVIMLAALVALASLTVRRLRMQLGPVDSASHGIRQTLSPRWAALYASVVMVPAWCVPSVVAQEGTPAAQELAPIEHARISAVYDLDARPPYAYALERENLRVLDVGDPTRVREVANLGFEGPRSRGVLHGSGLYLSGYGQPLAVVDIADPAQPRWVGEHPEVGVTQSSRLVDDHLYVVGRDADTGSHTLFAMALPEAAAIPVRVATLGVGHDASLRLAGIAHDDGRLFIMLRQTAGVPGEIIVVNIEDPPRPTVERRITLPDGPRYYGLAVRGNVAYATTYDPTGLRVLDLGGSGRAEVLSSVTDGRLRPGGEPVLHEDVLYTGLRGSAMLATIDVSDPQHPRVAQFFVPEGPEAVGLGFSIAEDRLYLSGDMGPSPIFDVSSPLEPRYLGRWEYEGGWARRVVLRGRIAVVQNWGAGLLLYEASDASSLTRVGVYRSRGHSLDHVAGAGDRILLSHGPMPSEVIDISDPSAPTLVHRFEVPEAVAAAVLTPSHVIQAYASGGLGIVDLREPTRTISHLTVEGPATDVAVEGDVAVVAHLDGGLTAVDVRVPEAPVLLGRSAGSESDGVAMVTRLVLSSDGTRAYTVRGSEESELPLTVTVHDLLRDAPPRTRGELEIPHRGRQASYDFPLLLEGSDLLMGAGTDLVRVDVSDPGQPAIRSRWHLALSMAADGLALRDDHLFVAAAEDGLKVFELPIR